MRIFERWARLVRVVSVSVSASASVPVLSRRSHVLCTWPLPCPCQCQCQCVRGLMPLELLLLERASCSSFGVLLLMFFSRCSLRVRVQGARAGRDPRQDLLEAPGALQGTPLPLVCLPAACFLFSSSSFESSHPSALSRTLPRNVSDSRLPATSGVEWSGVPYPMRKRKPKPNLLISRYWL